MSYLSLELSYDRSQSDEAAMRAADGCELNLSTWEMYITHVLNRRRETRSDSSAERSYGSTDTGAAQ